MTHATLPATLAAGSTSTPNSSSRRGLFRAAMFRLWLPTQSCRKSGLAGACCRGRTAERSVVLHSHKWRMGPHQVSRAAFS